MSDAAADSQKFEKLIGFNQELGFELVEWSEGHAVMEMDIKAMHLNRSGVLHGGVMATILDAVCGFCGVWRPEGEERALALTLTFSTNFMGQAREGRIRAVAERKGGGRKIFFSRGEVFGPDGSILAMAEGSYRIRQSDPFSSLPRDV